MYMVCIKEPEEMLDFNNNKSDQDLPESIGSILQIHPPPKVDEVPLTLLATLLALHANGHTCVSVFMHVATVVAANIEIATTTTHWVHALSHKVLAHMLCHWLIQTLSCINQCISNL